MQENRKIQVYEIEGSMYDDMMYISVDNGFKQVLVPWVEDHKYKFKWSVYMYSEEIEKSENGI